MEIPSVSVIGLIFSTEYYEEILHVIDVFCVSFVSCLANVIQRLQQILMQCSTAGPDGQHRIAFIRACRLCYCGVNFVCIVPQSKPSNFVITTTTLEGFSEFLSLETLSTLSTVAGSVSVGGIDIIYQRLPEPFCSCAL